MSTDPTPTDFIPPELEEIAKLLPNYEVLSFIAKGGMGAVYLAKQKSLDREVAIKILPRHFGEDAEFRSSFEAEAKSMAKLNHPNLVGIYDFGQVDGMLYIIMEMVHGESLYHAAYGKTIEATEAGRIVCEICHGLANAHKQGILHRDIKPANILLDPSSSPKIGDFGLARPVGDHEADSAFGTPGYTAPEVVHNPTAVDESTDLYSVGAILYELLTGKLPEQCYMPAANLVQCDPEFDKIIRKAMNSDPVLRYRSAEAMAEAIENIINEKNKPAANSRLITAASSGAARPASHGGSPPPPIKTSSSGPFIRNIIIILVLLGAIYAAWEHYKTSKVKRDQENALIIEENERKKQEAKQEKAKLREEREAAFKSSNKATRRLSNNNSGQKNPGASHPEREPLPDPVVSVQCKELDVIREKCFDLVNKLKNEHEKKLNNNVKSYHRDLDHYMRSLTNQLKDAYLPGINEMKNRCGKNRIPGTVSRQNMPEKVEKILDYRLKAQSDLQKKFIDEIEKIRGFYRKNLNKIVSELKNSNRDHEILTVQQEINATKDGGQDFVDYILKAN